MSFKVLTAKKMQRIFQFKYSNYINSSQPEISSCYFGYVAHLIKYTTIVCVVHLTCRFDLMYLYCAKINLNFTFHSQIRIHALLPFTIVAVLCALTGVICFKCLPETANKPTPESMASVIINKDAIKAETAEANKV